MRRTIISVFLFILVLSVVACNSQKQASSGTSASASSGSSSASSANSAASNNIAGALGDVGTADQDLSVSDTSSATDSGLDDVQTI